MLTNVMDVITEFLMNFELFGIKPFRGIFTLVSSTGFWTLLIGLVIFFVFCNFFRKTGIFTLINLAFRTVFNIIKSILKFIGWVISQTYIMILMSMDSARNNYDKAEYWGRRMLTTEGIKSYDLTGSNEILIPHLKPILSVIHLYRKTSRILSNVKLSIVKKVARKVAK